MERDLRKRNKVINRVKRFSVVVFLRGIFPILIFIIILFLSFILGFWNIKRFEYSDSSFLNITTKEIDSYLEEFKGKNIFFVSPKDVEEKILNSNSYVKRVYVKKIIPSKLLITIKEYEPYFIGYSSDTCLLFSKEGIKVEKVCAECEEICFEQGEESLVRISSDQALEANGRLLFYEEFQNIFLLFEEFGYDISIIEIEDGIVTVYDNKDHSFVFDITYNLDIQLARWYLVAKKIVSDMIEFKSIDMRFERPVMKYK